MVVLLRNASIHYGMVPNQGREPARVSPFLLEVLEAFHSERPAAGMAATVPAVAELSRLFTKEREALGRDYLGDPALAAAYLKYFFPVNVAKIQVLLDELPVDWHKPFGQRSIRVLDVGTGPGTGAMAVLDWLNRHNDDALRHLTVVAVDASAAALRQARDLWTACSRRLGIAEHSLALCHGDVAQTKDDWYDTVAEQGPYDVIIVANCLNELFIGSRQPIKERSSLLSRLLARLATHGTMMVVEPALRETSRSLHQIRDGLLAEKRCTVYSPCLHEQHCPALVNPDDWCHEERPWEPPATVRKIDREVGFIKDALKFSYLLLRTDGRAITERSPDIFRMVSELRKLKGDTRAWLCNELGRSEVGRLDRARSDGNSAWDDSLRGTIVRIESLKRKDGATLHRIPAEGTVKIVKPI